MLWRREFQNVLHNSRGCGTTRQSNDLVESEKTLDSRTAAQIIVEMRMERVSDWNRRETDGRDWAVHSGQDIPLSMGCGRSPARRDVLVSDSERPDHHPAIHTTRCRVLALPKPARRCEYLQLNLRTAPPAPSNDRTVEMVFWWTVFSCVSSLTLPFRSICRNMFRADSSRWPSRPGRPFDSMEPTICQPCSSP